MEAHNRIKGGVVKPTCAQTRVRAGRDPLTAVTAPPGSIRHKTETPIHKGGNMPSKIVVTRTVLKPARRNETLEDVIKAMREYADAMDVRQKEAVEGDRYLSCGCVALRMREFARRMENVARRKNEQPGGPHGRRLRTLVDEAVNYTGRKK